MNRMKNSKGMTLLEVALAVALTVGVVGSAMVFYHHAVEVRRRLEDEIRRISVQARIMDHLTNQLRFARTYPYLGMSLYGDDRQIEFVTATLPGKAAWALRRFTDEAIPPEQDLQLVGYRLRTSQDEDPNETAVEGIERTHRKVLAVRIIEDPQDGEGDQEKREGPPERRNMETALMGPGVKFIAFRYFRDGAWSTNWGGGDLPQAVEVTLGSEELPEETEVDEYPYPVFRRVIYLPG